MDAAATRLLTGPDAGDILRAALGAARAELLSWRAEQVDYQPRRGSTAGYRVRVRWPDRRVTEERFGAYTGEPPADGTAGALMVGDGADRVAVWRFPHDPYLPGLAAAYDPAAVAGLLGGFGLGVGPVRLALRAYRPRRRAVVEASGPGGRLFLKVVRPDRVAELHRRHRLVTGAGVPAPASLGYTPDGLLVLAALPGQTLRQALRHRGTPLPPGAAVLRLLDRLPGELTEAAGRRSWRDRAGHYAEVVAGVLPPQADRVRQLATAITGQTGTGPLVPVHGDLYEAQLRVAGGRITGVLDIDTAGPGERLDDLACLLGHLSVLAQLDPARAAATNRLGAGYLAAFERTVDPADLRSRVAAVVLSLATGPHRVQERGWRRATRCRVDLVERWLESARNLRRLSPWPQGQLMPALDAGGRQPAGPGGAH
ncbi:MAG: phosphotransferase [Micromonosporaceae bacterium]|nr:phosphotransferase [Micromonosporaceae bacterium]